MSKIFSLGFPPVVRTQVQDGPIITDVDESLSVFYSDTQLVRDRVKENVLIEIEPSASFMACKGCGAITLLMICAYCNRPRSVIYE